VSMNIPPYPAADGPNIAARLRNGESALEESAASIERRLGNAEDAMSAALSAQDQRRSTQDRLRAMAAQHRKQSRRS
jgi:hypothetical protein